MEETAEKQAETASGKWLFIVFQGIIAPLFVSIIMGIIDGKYNITPYSRDMEQGASIPAHYIIMILMIIAGILLWLFSFRYGKRIIDTKKFSKRFFVLALLGGVLVISPLVALLLFCDYTVEGVTVAVFTE